MSQHCFDAFFYVVEHQWLTVQCTSPRNVANAQDRMGLLVKTLQDDGNRFAPGLIVLSWEDESMDNLAERVCLNCYFESHY